MTDGARPSQSRTWRGAPRTDPVVARVTRPETIGSLPFEGVTSRRKPALLRALAIAGLAGQLAAVADALFVEHVTCLVHGDRIHVTSAAPVVAARWAALRDPAIDGDGHDHVQCLLDDDIDFVPPPGPAALFAPAPSTTPPLAFDPRPAFSGRYSLYRLAPKNSPPG